MKIQRQALDSDCPGLETVALTNCELIELISVEIQVKKAVSLHYRIMNPGDEITEISGLIAVVGNV